MENLSRRLIQFSTTRVAVISLLGFFAFTALVLPGQARQAEMRSAGSGSPDLSFFYSASDLYRMAEAYGEAGRADYIQERFTFDLLFPLIYTAFLLTSASWLVQRAGLANTRMGRLNLVPLLAFGFDLLENSLASLVLARYPQATPIAANLAPVMTFLKWTSLGVSFLVLLIGLILAVAGKRNTNTA